MRDAMAEVRYQALRTRLNDLQYYQPLSTESSALASALLADLVGSAEKLQALKRQNETQAKRLQGWLAEVEALQQEASRLQADNNAMHLGLIEAGEGAERRETEMRLRLRALEDEVESVRFSLHRVQNAARGWEEQLHNLRAEAANLLQPESLATSPPQALATAVEALAAGGATASRLASQGPSDVANTEALGARLGLLTETLGRCSRHLAEIEQATQAGSQRAETLEEAAAAAGERLAADGPDIAVLRRRTEGSRLSGEVAALRADAVKRAAEYAELEEGQARLENACFEARQEATTLRQVADQLREEEAQAAAAAARVAKGGLERSAGQSAQRGEAQRAHERLGKQRWRLKATAAALGEEVARLSQEEQAEMTACARVAGELEAEARAEAEVNSAERRRLGVRTAHLESRIAQAEAEGAEAEVAQRAVEAEIARADAAAEESLEQLSAQMAEIESVIMGGAQLQYQSQRSGAQVQLLSSSVHGLQTEREALLAHLQQKQRSLHEEALKSLDLRMESQRLGAVVESLGSTRGQWTGDLDRSVSALRRAHASLGAAQRAHEAAQETHARVRREHELVEQSAEVAANQHGALAAEVQELSDELRQERLRGAEVRARVDAAHGVFRHLEAQAQGARGGEGSAAARHAGLERLRRALHEARTERCGLEEARDAESSELRRRVLESEAGMSRLQSELEEVMRRHDMILLEKEQVEARRELQEAQAHNEAARSAGLDARRRELLVAAARAEDELAAAQAAEEGQAAMVARLQSDLQQMQNQIGECSQARAALEVATEHKELECRRARASEHASEEELAASKARVAAISARCDELHGDMEELMSLVSGAEAARHELGAELCEQQQRLGTQRRAREAAAERGSDWCEEQRTLASEVQALRQAAAALDAERDERQRLADVRSQEVEELLHSNSAQQRAIMEAQSIIDELRPSICGQQECLAEAQRDLAARRHGLQALRDGTERLREEARDSATESKAVLDDLMHMTKENQNLHEEVRVLEHRVLTLSSAAQGGLVEQKHSFQHLKAVELERDDVLRLCQQVRQQTSRQAALIERLRAEGGCARTAVAELGVQLQLGLEAEEHWSQREAQLRSDSSVLEGQLNDLAARILAGERAGQELLEEDARLDGDVVAAAAAARGAGQREALRAQEAATLRMRRQQLETAMQSTLAEAAAHRRLAEECREEAHRLEALLEEERSRYRRGQREGEALRECLASPAAGVAAAAGSGSRPAGAAGAGAAASGPGPPGAKTTLQELQRQVEERYAEVGELDAQRERLAAELLRLRAALRGAAGAGGAAGGATGAAGGAGGASGGAPAPS